MIPIPKYCECGHKAVAKVRGRYSSVDKDHTECTRCYESFMDSMRARYG